MQLPSSEESKIALQARLGLSPSKLIHIQCQIAGFLSIVGVHSLTWQIIIPGPFYIC